MIDNLVLLEGIIQNSKSKSGTSGSNEEDEPPSPYSPYEAPNPRKGHMGYDDGEAAIRAVFDPLVDLSDMGDFDRVGALPWQQALQEAARELATDEATNSDATGATYSNGLYSEGLYGLTSTSQSVAVIANPGYSVPRTDSGYLSPEPIAELQTVQQGNDKIRYKPGKPQTQNQEPLQLDDLGSDEGPDEDEPSTEVGSKRNRKPGESREQRDRKSTTYVILRDGRLNIALERLTRMLNGELPRYGFKLPYDILELPETTTAEKCANEPNYVKSVELKSATDSSQPKEPKDVRTAVHV